MRMISNASFVFVVIDGHLIVVEILTRQHPARFSPSHKHNTRDNPSLLAYIVGAAIVWTGVIVPGSTRLICSEPHHFLYRQQK